MPTINKPKKKKNTDSDLDKKKRSEVYNSAMWRKMRLTKQMQNPLCEVCAMQNKIVLAEDIHHLVSFTKFNGAERDAIAFDSNNLISLCKQCHNLIHHGYLKGATSKEEIADRIKLHNNENEDKPLN